jgi:hypothetical protein
VSAKLEALDVSRQQQTDRETTSAMRTQFDI